MLREMLVYLIELIANVLIWIIILRVVLSVADRLQCRQRYNPYVRMFARFADRVTEPLLGPIRRAMPIWRLDISPMILLVVIYLVEYFLVGLLLAGRILSPTVSSGATERCCACA